MRGSREFASRADYWHFICDLVSRRNRTRVARWQEEQEALRPLPGFRWLPAKKYRFASLVSARSIWDRTYIPSLPG
ncbi:hypothetical protein [Ktedonobacter sp. SOSP1-52]|uniref:hypothetical protein n=1 Tax=Ktedonobacter sp. SOSP1-52 TaxID=2778366 RepID=UPI001916245F|nr:hypothetical protein [Ktedonobacter sp. SOSP1-52]